MKTFKLKKGEIDFQTDKVYISDNSSNQSKIQLFSSALWSIYGTISVLRYFNTGDQFLLWTGLFIGTAHLIIFILNLLRSNQNEIFFHDIKSIKLIKRFGSEFLYIRLKNNKMRRVSGIEKSSELLEYFKSGIENNQTR